MPPPNRSRNKNGRWRKKRRDAHDYKEREMQRPLQISDTKPPGAYSLGEEVVLAIREGLKRRADLKAEDNKDA